MRDKLLELISELDPDIQALVADVVWLEREHLSTGRRVKENIRDQIDKYAKESLRDEGTL